MKKNSLKTSENIKTLNKQIEAIINNQMEIIEFKIQQQFKKLTG